MTELAGLLVTAALIFGILLGKWLARISGDKDRATVLPPINLTLPCPPCKTPRFEPPGMAELAREQSDRVKNEWINDRLPVLMDRAMQLVHEAGKEGRRSVVFYTGEGRVGIVLGAQSKEAALACELRDILKGQGFDVSFDWAAHKTDSHGFGMIISW